MDPSFVARLDLALAAKGMSQSALSRAIGSSPQFIGQIRCGERSGKSKIPKIAETLGVSVEWLTLGGMAHAPSWSLSPRDFWMKVLYHAEQVATDEELDAHHPPRTEGQRDALIRVAERHTGAPWTAEDQVKARAGWDEWRRDASLLPPARAIEFSAGPDELLIMGTAAASDGRNWGVVMDQPEVYRWKKNRFLVRVHGDSAVPVALPGQMVIVDRDRPIRTNNLVLLITTQGAMVKRWCEDSRAPGGGLYVSINGGIDTPFIDPKSIKDKWAIVGVLFE
jgi:phage repressor protein C with HTH and peptisase S24 domain